MDITSGHIHLKVGTGIIENGIVNEPVCGVSSLVSISSYNCEDERVVGWTLIHPAQQEAVPALGSIIIDWNNVHGYVNSG